MGAATERILSLTNHFQDSLNPADELQKAEKMASYKFAGWMGLDKESEKGKMVWQEYEPKTWTEDDVDIKITHSGICGSDLHTLRAGWGPTNYPCVVGHEIVGTAVRVGSKAEGDIKVGDIVGVGAQGDSCQSRDGPCSACENGEEQYCGRCQHICLS